MKKAISVLNIVLLIMLMFTACSQKAENKIIWVENPPFTEEITLNVGQEKQGYFIVFCDGDFRLDDIEFKNNNEEVAKLSFLKIEGLHYVFYTVEALEKGETYIWFETKDADVSSSMIKVSVGENSVLTSENITEIENTTQAESTTEADNNTEITQATVSTGSYDDSTAASDTADHSENIAGTTEKAKNPDETTKRSDESTTGESTSKETEQQTVADSDIVYISPTGKRYHLKASCAGKNAIKTTLEEAETDGKTPCKKCAGG